MKEILLKAIDLASTHKLPKLKEYGVTKEELDNAFNKIINTPQEDINRFFK